MQDRRTAGLVVPVHTVVDDSLFPLRVAATAANRQFQIVGQSGIVAILTAGITMRSYAHRNLSSRKTQEFAGMLSAYLSYLFD